MFDFMVKKANLGMEELVERALRKEVKSPVLGKCKNPGKIFHAVTQGNPVSMGTLCYSVTEVKVEKLVDESGKYDYKKLGR